MPSGVYLEETISIGTPVTLVCRSPHTTFTVLFEDDGESGYFYGLQRDFRHDPPELEDSEEHQPILDALHIYNVANVVDKDILSVVQIVWSSDGLKSALVLSNYPHAVFDFEAGRAYCRTNFPPPLTDFTNSHEWDNRAIDLFR
jgi:hypothetical protein